MGGLGPPCEMFPHKWTYLTRDFAKEAIKAMRATGRLQYPLSAFKCSGCGYFHVGGKRNKSGELFTREQHRQHRERRDAA